MGYRPPRKIYNLDFTGTEHDGLQVRMRGMTVGEELEWNSLRASDDASAGQQVFDIFADLLLNWNVEDEQGPVPTTPDGIRSQDGAFIGDILTALQTAAAGVPAPLPEGSHSGGPSLVASIPTETLSASPQSLPA